MTRSLHKTVNTTSYGDVLPRTPLNAREMDLCDVDASVGASCKLNDCPCERRHLACLRSTDDSFRETAAQLDNVKTR